MDIDVLKKAQLLACSVCALWLDLTARVFQRKRLQLKMQGMDGSLPADDLIQSQIKSTHPPHSML